MPRQRQIDHGQAEGGGEREGGQPHTKLDGDGNRKHEWGRFEKTRCFALIVKWLDIYYIPFFFSLNHCAYIYVNALNREGITEAQH